MWPVPERPAWSPGSSRRCVCLDLANTGHTSPVPNHRETSDWSRQNKPDSKVIDLGRTEGGRSVVGSGGQPKEVGHERNSLAEGGWP